MAQVYEVPILLGMEEWSTNNKGFQVYPNPSNGLVHYSSDYFIESIEVYQSDGVLIRNIQYDAHRTINAIDLNISESGVYTLKFLTRSDEIISKRIVIQ